MNQQKLLETYRALRNQMKEKWNRFVPISELLEDRWSRAQDMGFGEGSNVYDSAVILGDVRVGKQCWVGPNTYLDGSGKLSIGNHVTVGVGSSIFSHISIQRDLSGGAFPSQFAPTNIGNHVFMAPYCVIEMGANLSDYSVIMSHSVVKKPVEAYSIMHGNPAKRVGRVIIQDGSPPEMRFSRLGMSLMTQK